MIVSATQRTLGKVAAVLGLIQGIAWFGMSLSCIILYNASQIDLNNTTFDTFLEKAIYSSFISDSDAERINFVIRPRDFTILMWFYLLLSAIWFVVSFDHYIACQFNKKGIPTRMILWGCITGMLSLIDLVFTCLLFRDYLNCGSGPEPNDVSCHLATGIVMTLAARGYTLWLLNVGLTFLMFWNAWQIIKEDYASKRKFENYSIPRVRLGEDTSNQSTPKYPRDGYPYGMEGPSAQTSNPPLNRPNNFRF